MAIKLDYNDKEIIIGDQSIERGQGLRRQLTPSGYFILFNVNGQEYLREQWTNLVDKNGNPFASTDALISYVYNNFFRNAAAETLAAAKLYSDGKVVAITQAAYDALPVKVTGTLYCITG